MRFLPQIAEFFIAPAFPSGTGIMLVGLWFIGPVDSVPAAQATRVCCIGNSITMGAKLEESKSYPRKLGVLLGSDYKVHNGGMGGACVVRAGERNYLGSEELQDVIAFEPDIITIMLGTNDSRPVNWQSKDDFIDDYTTLIDTLQALQSDPAIRVCLPPPAFSHEHEIYTDTIVEKIIPMIRQIAERETLSLIDTHTPFVDRSDLYGSDGIHFNDAGTTLMAQVMYDALSGQTGTARVVRREADERQSARRAVFIVWLTHGRLPAEGERYSLTGRAIGPAGTVRARRAGAPVVRRIRN